MCRQNLCVSNSGLGMASSLTRSCSSSFRVSCLPEGLGSCDPCGLRYHARFIFPIRSAGRIALGMADCGYEVFIAKFRHAVQAFDGAKVSTSEKGRDSTRQGKARADLVAAERLLNAHKATCLVCQMAGRQPDNREEHGG
jgi:hypothetical protein